MVAPTLEFFPGPTTQKLDAADCVATLERTCFGHLSFLSDEHVDVIPLRFAFHDDWLYFRANAALEGAIRRSPWMAITISELRGPTEYASVLVRGGCYVADETGSGTGDARALEGIKLLRDRPRVGREEDLPVERSLRVFRLRADAIIGSRTYVPCPPGNRPYDARELSRLREAGMAQSLRDDARGDDDGMAGASEVTGR
jgi:nitroimidazol reductase NimA-like FMN-containing flavoprotein (pyridoxamine 5'-phosphate oxidase superfamily)